MINQELLRKAIAEAYKVARENNNTPPENAPENVQEGQQKPSEGEQ